MDNDAIFMQSLKNGEERAYSCLIEKYHHELCAYAHSLIRDKEMAEDIVQSVYGRTWEKRHKLKIDASIRSFLYKSVYNEFIDQYRKNKFLLPLENRYIEVLDEFIEKDEAKIQRLFNLVQHEIQNLPPKSRTIFILSKKDGLTNLEIAKHLNVSLKTVESHITKAFSAIRKKINEKVKIEVILFLMFGKRRKVKFF